MATLQKDIEKLAEERDGALKSLADVKAELAAFQQAAQAASEDRAAYTEWAKAEITKAKAACPPLESGFSLNVSFTGDKTITAGQVTFRTPDVAEWRQAFDEFAAMVKERGWHFAPAPEKPPERAKLPIQSGASNDGQPATPPVKEQAQGQPAQTLTFPASSLTATITDGKTYWKVKGGRFGKWGVTVWPETLDAAGFGALDPTKPYDLSGWTAEYVEKEGKPDKVVRLHK